MCVSACGTPGNYLHVPYQFILNMMEMGGNNQSHKLHKIIHGFGWKLMSLESFIFPDLLSMTLIIIFHVQ